MREAEEIQIHLLGGLSVEHRGQRLHRFRTQKTGALLAYLAYHRGRRFQRDVLVELFWPDDRLEGGRGSLSTALWSLKQDLAGLGLTEEAVLVADRTSVFLDPAFVATDVAEFQAALKAAKATTDRTRQAELLAQAVALYEGELLPGCHEPWIYPEQTRCEVQFQECLQALISLREAAGDLIGARELALRAVQVDPLDEDACLRLMRLYLATGQPRAARPCAVRPDRRPVPGCAPR